VGQLRVVELAVAVDVQFRQLLDPHTYAVAEALERRRHPPVEEVRQLLGGGLGDRGS